MKKYMRLLRVHHYIKNMLVFSAILFNGSLLEKEKFFAAVLGFIVFCMTASAVYIINDIRDIKKDRIHPVKCRRPLASGEISVKSALVCAVVLIAGAVILSLYSSSPKALMLVILYFVLNIFYSMGLKNIPIVDVGVLAFGFCIRVFYGAILTNIKVSEWLYLTVMAMSFYLALGKRRNELRMNKSTRKVLNLYTESFLDKNMYVFLTLADVFYALWSFGSRYLVFTVPIVLLITMKYSLDVEKDSDGDPAEIIFNDIILLFLCIFYLAGILWALYFS